MEAIKNVAVREDNNGCLSATPQYAPRLGRGNPQFWCRLCGPASICKFQVNCPNCNTEVTYTENVLQDALTRGLVNSEFQLDLLGDGNQDMSLEEVFEFIEAKEAGK